MMEEVKKVRRPFNPIRGTIWLPGDLTDLNEIEWDQEPAQQAGFPPVLGAEAGRTPVGTK